MVEPLRVLIVEDDDLAALPLLDILRRQDFEVEHERVQDTRGLEHALGARCWDVVLSGFDMSQLSGLDAVRTVRERQPHLPFIVISETVGEDTAVRVMRAGASDFLVRDRLQRLGSAIRRELAASHVQQERVRNEAAVSHLVRVLAAIRQVNQLIVHEREPEALLRQACRLLVDTRGYSASWAAVFPHDQLTGTLIQASWHEAFRPCMEFLVAGGRPRCLDAVDDAQGGVALTDIPSLCLSCPHDPPRHEGPVFTAALAYDGYTYGLLCVAVPSEIEVTDEELGLMSEVAGDLGMALHHIAAQHRLRETRDRYQQLFAAAPRLITSVDADGFLRMVNQRVTQALGYRPDELIGEPMLRIFHPDDHARARASLVESLSSGRPVDDSYTMVHKDGSHRQMLINSTALTGQDGAFHSTICIFEDITARVATERALEERERLLSFAIEQVPIPVLIAEAPDVGITRYNKAALELMAVPADESAAIPLGQQRTFWPTFHTDGTPCRVEDLPLTRAIERRETTQGVELLIRRDDGEHRVLAHAAPLVDERDHVVAGIVAFPDITELRHIEAELLRFDWLMEKESEHAHGHGRDAAPAPPDVTATNRTRQILDTVGSALLNTIADDLMALLDTSVAIYEVDGDYALGRATSAWCRRLFEASFARCGTDNIAEALASGAWSCHESCWRHSAQAAIRTGEPTDIRCVGGVRLYAVPIRAGDEIIGALNIGYGNPPTDPDELGALSRRFGLELEELQSIGKQYKPRPEFILETARKRCHTAARVIGEVVARQRADEARSRLDDQLQQAQRLESIGRLAGGVAHDFNNMLAVIGNYGELVMDDLPPNSQCREDMQEILDASDRAAALTRQLLTFSRRQPVKPTVLDLNAVVENLERMLRRVIGENIELRTRLAEPLGSIFADRGGLEQLLMNLVVNARDAMPTDGTLTIQTADVQFDESCACSPIPAPTGSYVMVAVSDTGCGMRPEVRQRIFEPFFTTKQAGEGTGLGLATVYGFVKQSGGGLSVRSEDGVGTTIEVYLNRSNHPGDVSEVVHEPASTKTGSETILLVEDEGQLRRLCERVLDAAGYLVLSAADPEEAIRVSSLLEVPPDLLLTDVVMPKMNGFELAGQLQERFPDLQVLYMSGYADDAIAQHGQLEPSTHFLPKPFERKDLLGLVRQALGREKDLQLEDRPSLDENSGGTVPAPPLPPSLTQRLLDLTERGDAAALRSLIELEVRCLDPHIADQLADMIERYAYEQVSAWLRDGAVRQGGSDRGATP